MEETLIHQSDVKLKRLILGTDNINKVDKMEKITKPKVKGLASGTNFTAKQMQGNAGDLLPEHLANVESIIFIHEGECILKMNGEDKLLKPGDALIIPPETKHQFKVITDFKGVHFMPKEIEFQFF